MIYMSKSSLLIRSANYYQKIENIVWPISLQRAFLQGYVKKLRKLCSIIKALSKIKRDSIIELSRIIIS